MLRIPCLPCAQCISLFVRCGPSHSKGPNKQTLVDRSNWSLSAALVAHLFSRSLCPDKFCDIGTYSAVVPYRVLKYPTELFEYPAAQPLLRASVRRCVYGRSLGDESRDGVNEKVGHFHRSRGGPVVQQLPRQLTAVAQPRFSFAVLSFFEPLFCL
jgi:hypothetical protein